MSYFPGLKLTKAGEQLLAKVSGNLSETISFRKAELGSGTINSDDEIRFLTALKEKWKDVNISDCKIVGDEQTQVQIELQFDNAGINTNKIFRELGIYATANDGREVLFAYSNAKENFDYIPAATDNPQSFVINILITITSNTKVNAQIDLNSYVTLRKFNEELAKKLDKGAVSSEYDTAKKIEDKIKTAQGTADNKLNKGSVPEKYNSAEKIGNELDLKQNIIDSNLRVDGNTNIIEAINYSYNKTGNGTFRKYENGIPKDGKGFSGFHYYLDQDFNNKIFDIDAAYGYLIECHYNGPYGSLQIASPDSQRSRSLAFRTTYGGYSNFVNNDWNIIMSSGEPLFLGALGVNNINYIQTVGTKTEGQGYVDKVTGKLYRAKTTNTDVSVTNNFELADNISNSKKNTPILIFNENVSVNREIDLSILTQTKFSYYVLYGRYPSSSTFLPVDYNGELQVVNIPVDGRQGNNGANELVFNCRKTNNIIKIESISGNDAISQRNIRIYGVI